MESCFAILSPKTSLIPDSDVMIPADEIYSSVVPDNPFGTYIYQIICFLKSAHAHHFIRRDSRSVFWRANGHYSFYKILSPNPPATLFTEPIKSLKNQQLLLFYQFWQPHTLNIPFENIQFNMNDDFIMALVPRDGVMLTLS